MITPSKIIHKYSFETGAAPSADILSPGELAFNATDSKFFWLGADGHVKTVQLDLMNNIGQILNDHFGTILLKKIELRDGLRDASGAPIDPAGDPDLQNLVVTYMDTSTHNLGDVRGATGTGVTISLAVDWADELPTTATDPALDLQFRGYGTAASVVIGDDSTAPSVTYDSVGELTHIFIYLPDTNTWKDIGEIEGVTGPRGPIGFLGATGASGVGATGAVGATGLRGVVGPGGGLPEDFWDEDGSLDDYLNVGEANGIAGLNEYAEIEGSTVVLSDNNANISATIIRAGEIIWNTDAKRLHVGDGFTVGGLSAGIGVNEVTANTTLSGPSNVIMASNTSNITVTLPSPIPGATAIIKRTVDSTHDVIVTTGVGTIDGDASVELQPLASINLVATLTNWNIIG